MHSVVPSRSARHGQAIHLYFGVLGKVDTEMAFAMSFAILSDEERARATRFKFERDRRLFVYGHALVRTALSQRATEVRPDAWSFVRDRYGRPFVAKPDAGRDLYFSLSHTEGCVACVASFHPRVGVDVEVVRRRPLLEDMATRTLWPGELALWRALPVALQTEMFFRYWTLKEAYTKARGLGLSLAFNEVALRLNANGAATLARAPGEDNPERWRLATMSPTRSHCLSVADGSGAASRWPVVALPWPLTQAVA